MSRYVQLDIDQVRRASGTQVSSESSATVGILRETVLEYLTEADEHLQSRILDAAPENTMFDTEQVISLVADQREYDLPENVYSDGYIKKAEFSYNGDVDNYIPVSIVTPFELVTGEGYDILNFQLRGNKLVVSPVPSAAGGKVRITYVKHVDSLQVRRGTVASTTNDGTYYTTIVLSATDLDESQFANHQFISTNDSRGTVLRQDIQYSSYDSGTRTLTLPASTVLLSAGAISAGDYVLVGQYSTTHSKLPKNCDRYRIAWATWKMQRTNSNTDSADQTQELLAIEDDILNTLAHRANGPQTIPIINSFWR